MANQDFAWRAEWALRTGLTAAALSAVLLFSPLFPALQFGGGGHGGLSPGGPAFAGFVCTLAADVTFGRTLINAWSIALVTIPCLGVAAAVLAAVGERLGPIVSLSALAVLTFAVQLLNLPPGGKRVGLSVLSDCLITAASANAFMKPICMMPSVLFGLGMALVGVLLPWPRWAATEIRLRMHYTASALRDVLHSLLAGLYGDAVARSSKAADQRLELLSLVQRNIATCHTRMVEARCGPYRRSALNDDAAFLRTLDEVLMSTKVMNDIFCTMDFTKLASCDKLIAHVRPALSDLHGSLCAGLGAMASWAPSAGRASDVSAALQRHADGFDCAFAEARKRLFFSGSDSEPIEAELLLTLYAFLFELDVIVGILWAFLTDSESILREQPCCHGTLAADLFPSQRHLRDLCQWRTKPQMKKKIIVAFKLTLAIVIAGAYGFYAFETPHPLAAYTIAYIGVDTIQGSNISFSVLRCVGTVAAAVYAELVVHASRSFSDLGSRAFVLAAIVAFVIPATYVRSNAAVSYAGNVAAFTCVILLLASPLGTDNADIIAHQRVLHTLIGVLIFVVVELFVCPMRSDSQLYAEVSEMLRAVRTEVSDFGKTFARELRHWSEGANGDSDVDDASMSSRGSEERDESEDDNHIGATGLLVRRDILQDLPSPAHRLGLITAQRVLLQHIGQEPALWRIPTKEEHISAILTVELRLVMMSLQLTRITRHAIIADSRLAVPASFAGLQDPSSRALLIAPMSHTFDELLDGMHGWVEHLIAGLQALETDFAPQPLRKGARPSSSLQLAVGGDEGDENRADAKAIAQADKHLCEAFAGAIRSYQERTLKAGAEGAAAAAAGGGQPPNVEVKVTSALMHAARGVLRALRDLEGPVVRAQAARLLDCTQAPLSRRRGVGELAPLHGGGRASNGDVAPSAEAAAA